MADSAIARRRINVAYLNGISQNINNHFGHSHAKKAKTGTGPTALEPPG
jgi:hypothetical protein